MTAAPKCRDVDHNAIAHLLKRPQIFHRACANLPSSRGCAPVTMTPDGCAVQTFDLDVLWIEVLATYAWIEHFLTSQMHF